MKPCTLLCIVALAGCYSKTRDGTTLVITTDWQNLAVYQLTFSATGNGQSAFGPTTLPATAPNAPLSSGQTVRVLLKDTWDGQALTVNVTALGHNAPVAFGTSVSPNIQPGTEVAVTVTLQTAPPDGGTNLDGGSDAGSDAGADAGADAGPLVCPPGPSTLQGTMCTATGWCWENPLPSSNILNAAFALPNCDVWAVGVQGTILHRVGGTWTAPTAPALNNLYGVWASGPNDAWAVGDCTTLLHWTGGTWTLAGPGASCASANKVVFSSVYGSGPNDIWAVGLQSDGGTGVFYHYDGGAWGQVATASPTVGIAPLNGVWTSGTTDAWAVGENGQVWYDDGSGWKLMAVQGPVELTGVSGSTPGDAWAVGNPADAGPQLFQLFGGITNVYDATNASQLLSVWAAPTGAVVSVGSSTAGLSLADSWLVPGASPTGASKYPTALRGTTGTPDGTVWSVGGGGAVYFSALPPADAGLNPDLPLNPTPGRFPAVNAIAQAGEDMWAVGGAGLVLRQQGDAGWNAVTPPTPGIGAGYNFQGVWMADAGEPFLVAGLPSTTTQGTWKLEADGGWTGLTTPSGHVWFSIDGRVAPNGAWEAWVAGSNAGLARVSDVGTPPFPACAFDGGLATTPDGGVPRLLSVWVAPVDGGVFAVGERGNIVLVTPPTPVGACVANVLRLSSPTASDLQSIWGQDERDIWIVGANSTVLRSQGGGAFVTPGFGAPSSAESYNAVAGNAQGALTDIWVAGNPGHIYHYRLGSTGWDAPIQMPSTYSILGLFSPRPGEVRAVGPQVSILHFPGP